MSIARVKSVISERYTRIKSRESVLRDHTTIRKMPRRRLKSLFCTRKLTIDPDHGTSFSVRMRTVSRRIVAELLREQTGWVGFKRSSFKDTLQMRQIINTGKIYSPRRLHWRNRCLNSSSYLERRINVRRRAHTSLMLSKAQTKGITHR
jgi:hypothetical protein